MKLINPNRSSYYNSIIEKFNDEKKPMSAGLSFGFSAEKYSWVADFLFKCTDNSLINKHVGYVSFFSDREIMHQEYKNVTAITDRYPFLVPTQFSPHTYELTTKQYRRISQNYAEFDMIEFMDRSGRFENMDKSGEVFTVHHFLGRLPLYKSVGFWCDMVSEVPSIEGYGRYVWGNRQHSVLHQLFENYMTFSTPPLMGGMSLPFGYTGDYIKNTVFNNNEENIRYIMDYKFGVDTKPPSRGILYEFDDVVCGTNNYDPQTPFVEFVNSAWVSDSPEFGHDGISDVLTFYPEIKDAGRVIPKKIFSYFSVISPTNPIKMLINPGVHLKEADDQSRVSFSACKHMFKWQGDPKYKYVLRTMDPYNPSRVLLDGIDLDTERNRRYSAVVMTEPYMVTKPLADGQVVGFRFVNMFGRPIKYNNAIEFYGNPTMFLQVKAPYSFIKELDSKLKEREYNDDIIHTVTVRSLPSPVPAPTLMIDPPLMTSLYNDFSNTVYRQDFCVDDLINGVVGVGVRKSFWIEDINETHLYSNDRMKVAGIGYMSETQPSGITVDFFNLYCSNYTPTSSYLPGDVSRTPRPNDTSELTRSSSYGNVQEYELFRPMIKLPGINGYIKIMKRDETRLVSRATDGEYVVTYVVEFPFCPGSAAERAVMDFTGGYKKTQICCKQSYIKAGSHRLSGGRYDSDNNRYVYTGDDSLTYQKLDFIPSNYSDKEYDGFTYPSHLVKSERLFDFLSMIRPKEDEFNYMGTYTMELPKDVSGDTLENLSHDIRLNFLVDNKVWKFGDRYSSYIGRENPSYIAGIDASSLMETFNHKDFNGVPDKKNWLYSYFSGFAKTDNNKSDIIVEMWKDGSWSPLNPISTDTSKIGDKLLLKNILIVKDTIVDESDGITSFIITPTLDSTTTPFEFSDSVIQDVISVWSHTVLKYDGGKSYHVIYAEPAVHLGSQMIKLYVKENYATLSSELFIDGITVVDITAIYPSDYVSVLSVLDPNFMISENQNYSISSCKVYENNHVIKYFPIGSHSFRIRVARRKEYPADGTTMQRIGKRSILDRVNGDYPWWNGSGYDTAFSCKKINLQESVKKFGTTYFAVKSK